MATRLPREERPISNDMFGVTVILGPTFGGWLTETVSYMPSTSRSAVRC